MHALQSKTNSSAIMQSLVESIKALSISSRTPAGLKLMVAVASTVESHAGYRHFRVTTITDR